jgi:hypothetical protein
MTVLAAGSASAYAALRLDAPLTEAASDRRIASVCSMSGQSAGEVVRVHLEAFSSRDLPAMIATMAPDAVFVTGRTLVAPEEFEEFFSWAMREIDPTMEIINLVVDGGRVACEFLESVTLEAHRKYLNRAAFYTVKDGVITSAKVYDERD